MSAGASSGSSEITAAPKGKYHHGDLLSFYLKFAHTLTETNNVQVDLAEQTTLLEQTMTSALKESVSQIF